MFNQLRPHIKMVSTRTALINLVKNFLEFKNVILNFNFQLGSIITDK